MTAIKRSDRDIVIELKSDSISIDRAKDLKLELYERYKLLIHKQWFKFLRQLGNYSRSYYYHDDFYSDSYMYFELALKAVSLEKVYNDNWLFYNYFNWYLSNLRNDMFRNEVKVNKKEKPLVILNRDGQEYINSKTESKKIPSVEEQFMIKENAANTKKYLNYCYNNLWSDKEKQIFDLKNSGKTYEQIRISVKLNYRTIIKRLKKMKEDYLSCKDQKIEV